MEGRCRSRSPTTTSSLPFLALLALYWTEEYLSCSRLTSHFCFHTV